LLSGFGPDLVQRLPEAQAAVAGGELGVDSQAVLVAQPQQEFAPTLGALAKAVLDGQQLPSAAKMGVAVGIGADDDQQTLAIVVEPRREIDAVGPNVDEAPPREIAALPVLMLGLPGRHHRRPAGPPIHVRRTRGQETAAGRRTVEAERPGASGPRSAVSASSNWPVETPFK